MTLKTLDGNNVIVWKIVSGERWDKLGDFSRSIISYNGGWVLVEKVTKEYYYG